MRVLDLDQQLLVSAAEASDRSGWIAGATPNMFRCLFLAVAVIAVLTAPDARSADNRTLLPIQEEVWALPLIHLTIAYVVRPVGNGPFPLAVVVESS